VLLVFVLGVSVFAVGFSQLGSFVSADELLVFACFSVGGCVVSCVGFDLYCCRSVLWFGGVGNLFMLIMLFGLFGLC